MTENEKKLREKEQKLKNLAYGTSSEGEKQAALYQLKNLRKRIKELKKQESATNTKKEIIQDIRIYLPTRDHLYLFKDLCYHFGIFSWSSRTTRSKRGFGINVRCTRFQAELLSEITQIITPRFIEMQKKLYVPVRKAYDEYNKAMKKYKKELFEANFEASKIDPKAEERINHAFEEDEDEEIFDEWD